MSFTHILSLYPHALRHGFYSCLLKKTKVQRHSKACLGQWGFKGHSHLVAYHRTWVWLTPELTLLAAILVYPPRTGEFHEGMLPPVLLSLGCRFWGWEMLARVAHLPTLSGCKHQLPGAAFCFFRFHCVQQRAYIFPVGARPTWPLATWKIKGDRPLAHLNLHKIVHFNTFPPLLKYHMTNTSWNTQKKVNRRKKLLVGLSTNDLWANFLLSL